jgi:hypothetical protein
MVLNKTAYVLVDTLLIRLLRLFLHVCIATNVMGRFRYRLREFRTCLDCMEA